MKTECSLCLCIPTYNRALVIQDFLENCGKYHFDAGIDVYIYDSSTNQETEQLVKKWMEEYKDQLFYIRMPEDIHSNKKVYKIWQFYGLQKTYDFIWMCRDAFNLDKEAVDLLMHNLQTQYDMITLEVFSPEIQERRIYSDGNLFFNECAWKSTLYGNVILNVQTFLANVDWNKYEDKYLKAEIINYSHVSFYFNRILELKKFTCVELPLATHMRGSKYKKDSGWRKDTFSVICTSWVKTIKMLPDCYTDKKKVMQDLAPNSVLVNEWSFRELKREGIYNFRIFLRYLFRWGLVCTVSYGKLFCIAALPYSIETRRENIKNIQLFTKFKKKHKKIYIYGAGVVGERYGKYLTQNKVSYDGYIVTNLSGNQKSLNNHPIIEIDQVEDRNNIGIIIAVSERISDEVIASLYDRGYHSQIFYSKGSSEWIRYYMKNC